MSTPWVNGWSALYGDTDTLKRLDVARNADGRLEVFGVNGQGNIWHTWQVAPGGAWIGGWAELYSSTDTLVSLRAAENADGRLEVFGVNAQGNIWHTWQVAPGGAWTGGWAELYTDSDSLTMLDVARNADGRLEVFGVNGQGNIWHTWQVAPGGAWIGGWAELYSSTDTLVSLRAAENADGRLEVFGVNAQGNIWHTWQVAPGGAWTGGWAELYTDSDSLTMLDVARNADGRLEVFGVNAQGNIWHTWQVAPGGAWIGGWAELYSSTDTLVSLRAAENADGRLEVFGVNAQGNIWHTWQVAPGGAWTGGWAELYTDSDSLTMLDVARNADGRLEVFGVNGQGNIWHTWQTEATSSAGGIQMCIDLLSTGPAHTPRTTLPAPPQIQPDGSITVSSSAPLTGVTEKMWNVGQVLRVKMNGGTPFVRSQIRKHAEEWTRYANIRFEFVDSSQDAEIRIAIDASGSSSSEVGRDAEWRLFNDTTMNFGWFTDDTSDAEFRRTVTHEFGHALGLVHEHQSPTGGIAWDREKAYAYFKRTQNWDRAKVDSDVFDRYSVTSTNYSAFDPNSIMEYRVPADITLDGKGVVGGTELSATDKEYIARWYPGPLSPSNVNGLLRTGDDCDEIDFAAEYGVVDPSTVEFVLSPASGLTWWKAIQVPTGSAGYHTLEMQDGKTASTLIAHADLDASRPIRFGKAKFLGIHTWLGFTWDVIQALPGGSRLSLTWKRDSC